MFTLMFTQLITKLICQAAVPVPAEELKRVEQCQLISSTMIQHHHTEPAAQQQPVEDEIQDPKDAAELPEEVAHKALFPHC